MVSSILSRKQIKTFLPFIDVLLGGHSIVRIYCSHQGDGRGIGTEQDGPGQEQPFPPPRRRYHFVGVDIILYRCFWRERRSSAVYRCRGCRCLAGAAIFRCVFGRTSRCSDVDVEMSLLCPCLMRRIKAKTCTRSGQFCSYFCFVDVSVLLED